MSNRPKKSPVLIVGGGIGGLAAALALAQNGIRVQLIEQAAEFKEIGAGIQLGPNVFRMFEVLGLTEAVSRFAEVSPVARYVELEGAAHAVHHTCRDTFTQVIRAFLAEVDNERAGSHGATEDS